MAEAVAKLKEVGLSVGAQKTHLTRHPKMIDRSNVVDGLAVLWEDGVFGRKCKIRDCTQICSSKQVFGEVETSSEFFLAPKEVAPGHCEKPNVAVFSLEFERVDDGQGTKGQNCELECEKRIGAKKPPLLEMDQWWRLGHRTGNCWIEKFNKNYLIAIRQRALSWPGHVARMDWSETCAKALRCRGLQWWRWRQPHWNEVEKEKWAGPPQKNYSKSTDGRTWCRQRSPSFLETQMALRNQFKFPARNPTCDLFTVGEVGLWSFWSLCVLSRSRQLSFIRACVDWPHLFPEKFSGY